MREIKYRAYDNQTKQFHYWSAKENKYDGIFWEMVKLPEFEPVEHHPGLKDKNGKEVYEGDYVTMHQFLFDGNEVESQIFGVIEYCEETASYHIKRIKNKTYEDYTGFQPSEGDEPICMFYGLHEETWEVIGDIHNNPELLAQKGN